MQKAGRDAPGLSFNRQLFGWRAAQGMRSERSSMAFSVPENTAFEKNVVAIPNATRNAKMAVFMIPSDFRIAPALLVHGTRSELCSSIAFSCFPENAAFEKNTTPMPNAMSRAKITVFMMYPPSVPGQGEGRV